MIASKSNPGAESDEGSWRRTRTGGRFGMLKERRGFRHARRVKYANRVALMSRAAEATGKSLPQGCKHTGSVCIPLEPVGGGVLEGKCFLTRYALSNVCSIKSHPRATDFLHLLSRVIFGLYHSRIYPSLPSFFFYLTLTTPPSRSRGSSRAS